MDRVFFDTNILVYAIDKSCPEKREIALALIQKHAIDGNGVASTQVLQEFYVAATKKLNVEPLNAKRHVKDFQIFDILQISASMVEMGIDCSILNQLSFWDGLIVSSAKSAKCQILYSEDLNDGQKIEGVKVVNPFAGKK